MTREEVIRQLVKHRTDLESFGVKSLALFGSVARGEEDAESDIDMLVEFSRPVGFFTFLDVKEYLENLLGKEVDLVTYDALKRQLRQRILQESVHAF
ncbi:MAG: nucleotidyltransferase family protein [bacterium]|nr:nucleotidyltransferase family protein [bacterium]